jgi:HAE1 family hydrophobic/amphiphilic exporter-1
VFSGMLGVTLFGIFLTPVFYVLLRSRRSRRLERVATTTAPPAQAAPQPSGGAGE